MAVEEDLGSGDGPSTTTSSRTYRTTTAAPTPAVWTCESELKPCYAHQICEDKPAVDCTDKESYPDGAKCHDFVCIPDPYTEAPDTVGKVDKPVSVERTVLLPGMTENKFWDKELAFKGCVGELDRSSSSSSNGDDTLNKVEVDDLILRDNADLEVRFTVLVAASTQQAVARDLGGPVFLRNLETSLGLSRPPYLVNAPPTLGTTTTITATTTPSAVADASTTTTNPKAASGGNAAGGLAPGAAAAVAVIVLIVLVGLPVGRHYYRRQRTGRLQVYGRLDNSAEHRNLAFVDDNTAFGTTAAASATEMGNAGAAAALYEDL